MTKVITYGTFDLLHYGHIRLLERAKRLGDYLIVGVTSDDYDISRGKINNQESLVERIAAVEATGLADEIIVEEYEGQKIDDIKRLSVDIFTVGSDWTGKFDYLNEYCRVIYLPRTEGVSSSDIRSTNRKLLIGTIGAGKLQEKIVKEMHYVNGVQCIEFDNTIDDISAVYVVTNAQSHYDDIKQALNCGKHVICESPIALNLKDYDELTEIAENRKLVLADAIKTAYSTAYLRLMVLAKSGKIGDIISVDAVCTSLADGAGVEGVDLSKKQNTICAWGPTALLPVFQLLGTNYKASTITTRILDHNLNFDGFTKIDFIYEKAVASIKIAKAAKAEGELVITGTKGYIYVPAPWWKTEYFEVRYENPNENKRYFYQLDGEGIRYEIVAFAKTIMSGQKRMAVEPAVTRAIIRVIEDFDNGNYIEI